MDRRRFTLALASGLAGVAGVRGARELPEGGARPSVAAEAPSGARFRPPQGPRGRARVSRPIHRWAW